VAKAVAGIRFNEHLESDGETVFRHACKLGLEGIASKRKDSPDWLKMKNPACAAVKRAAEAFTYLVRVDTDAADQSRSG
jgi:ATP-dependent DNA ligase